MSMTGRDGIIGTVSGALTAGIMLVSALVGGVFDNNTVKDIDSGGGDITIVVPAHAESCPPGWTYDRDKDEHAFVEACVQGKWRAVLNSDGSFNYAFQIDTPGAEFVLDSSLVPGWLK